ncbi:MAG TPA: DHA2 family efflux MFS transporter permease subunit, partial [Candidatus Lustribacter sp.]|nr:DHA2 family efflux MFS transporter permease subunit [Candidatus Lustribacter sp.]
MAATLAVAPAPARPAASPFLISLTVMLGMIMAIVDGTVVNVGLNTIAGTLGASLDDAAWVVTGYLLASVITMPLNGWLTAKFGRKRFYAGCVAIFTIASLLCGTATSVWQLTFYRILQGFGGGALQPTAQAIIFETFPPGKRGMATAIFGLGAMVGPALGPLMGGYIIDNATWPLLFLVNIPIGIAAFFMTIAFIPDPAYLEKPRGGIDWLGLALLSTGIGAIQYVLERGQHDDWFDSSTIVLLTVVSVIATAWFLVKTLRDPHPLVDLRSFRFPTFVFGNLLLTVVGFGLYGTALIMPLFFQTSMGMTAYDTGVALLPGALATAASMIVVGRLMQVVDARLLTAVGLVLSAWSCWALGDLNQYAGIGDIFWPRMIQGLGMGLMFVPVTTAMLSPLPKNELASATGVSMLVRQLGA